MRNTKFIQIDTSLLLGGLVDDHKASNDLFLQFILLELIAKVSEIRGVHLLGVDLHVEHSIDFNKRLLARRQLLIQRRRY